MDSHQKEIFVSIVKRYFPLKNSSLDLILSSCKAKYLNREEHLSQLGKVDAYEYFLLEGVIHRYVLNEEGENISSGLYQSGTVLTPHFARTIAGQSIFNLQALTQSVLAEVPVKIFDSLRYSYEDIRSFGLKVVEQELLTSLASETAHRSMSAKDRLLTFRKNYPNLENLVPHTIIASYLGITPVSFSRLRKELAGK